MTSPIERRLKVAEDATARMPSMHRAQPIIIMQPGETDRDAMLRAYGGEPWIHRRNGKPVPVIIIEGVNKGGGTAAPIHVEPAGGAHMNPLSEEDE